MPATVASRPHHEDSISEGEQRGRAHVGIASRDRSETLPHAARFVERHAEHVRARNLIVDVKGDNELIAYERNGRIVYVVDAEIDRRRQFAQIRAQNLEEPARNPAHEIGVDQPYSRFTGGENGTFGLNAAGGQRNLVAEERTTVRQPSPEQLCRQPRLISLRAVVPHHDVLLADGGGARVQRLARCVAQAQIRL
jgi:hypothetical protein